MTTKKEQLEAQLAAQAKAHEAAQQALRDYLCSAEHNVFGTLEAAKEELESFLSDLASEDIRDHEGCAEKYVAEASVQGRVYVATLFPEIGKSENFEGNDMFHLGDCEFTLVEKDVAFLNGQSLNAWYASDIDLFAKAENLFAYAKKLLEANELAVQRATRWRSLLEELYEQSSDFVDLDARCACGDPGAMPPCGACTSNRVGFADSWRAAGAALREQNK